MGTVNKVIANKMYPTPTQTSVLDWLQSIFIPNVNQDSVTDIKSSEESKNTARSAAAGNSSVLWGATAAAVIGAATAYALDEKRKQREDKSKRAATITSTKSNTLQSFQNTSSIPVTSLFTQSIQKVNAPTALDADPPDWLKELIAKGKELIENAKKEIQEKWDQAKQNLQKSPLGQLFPELTWDKLDPTERETVLQSLSNFGSYGQATADYIKQNMVEMGFFPQNTGAGYTILGHLILRPGIDLNSPFNNSLIVHEILHLEQSLLTRLSVYGELLAWQLQYKAYYDATGTYLGEIGAPFYDAKDPAKFYNLWQELSQLSPDSLQDLATAQQLMIDISPGYRSNKLPLEPFTKMISRTVIVFGNNVANSIINSGQNAATVITQTSQTIANKIMNLGTLTATKITQTSTAVANSISQAGQNAAKIVTQSSQNLAKNITAGGQTVANLVAKVNPEAANAVIKVSQSLSTTTLKVGQSIASGISSASQTVSNALQQGGQSLAKAVTSGSQSLANTVSKAGQAVANTVTKATQGAANTVKSWTTSIGNLFWKP